MTDEQPSKPATYGRGDIAELAQRAAQKQPPRVRGPESGPDRIDALVFPVGWNARGEAVKYELCSIGDHPVIGEFRVEGRDPAHCERKARWMLAESLMGQRVDGATARRRAHVAIVNATQMERRPGT